ncbi:hypothetical protein [Bradyrhizobium genosp. P]|uniref:hypothetical protein n=1 Tax=Bradyrhizobium genosp. P TaxID=83641 RepID=UPI003CEBB6F0
MRDQGDSALSHAAKVMVHHRQIQRHQIGYVTRDMQGQDLATIADNLSAIQEAADQDDAAVRGITFLQQAVAITECADRMRERCQRRTVLIGNASAGLQARHQLFVHGSLVPEVGCKHRLV